MAEIILLSSALTVVIVNAIYQTYRSNKLQFSIKQQNAIIRDLENRVIAHNTDVLQALQDTKDTTDTKDPTEFEEIEESVYGPLPDDKVLERSRTSERPYSEIHISKSKNSASPKLASPRRRSRSRSVGSVSSAGSSPPDDMVIDSHHTSKRSNPTSPRGSSYDSKVGSKVKRLSGGAFMPHLETIDSKRTPMTATKLPGAPRSSPIHSPRGSVQGASRGGSRIGKRV